MKTEIINAGRIIGFQQWLRKQGFRLLRARPFTDPDGIECYQVMWVEG